MQMESSYIERPRDESTLHHTVHTQGCIRLCENLATVINDPGPQGKDCLTGERWRPVTGSQNL